MTVTFFTPGAELGKYRLTENGDGSITVHLNDGEGVAAGWCTLGSRLDAAHLRQMADDADALFIRRKAASDDGHMRHGVPVPEPEDVSLPGLGAQGEPATGEEGPEVNTGQGHTEPHTGGTLREGLSGQPLLQEPAGGASPLDALPVPPHRDGKTRPEERQAGPADGDLEPLPPLPQRTPAGPPEPDDEPIIITRDELLSDWRAAHPGACSCPPGQVDPSCPQHGEPQPGGTIYPQLTEEALAGAEPLEQLAPEPEEDEAQT